MIINSAASLPNLLDSSASTINLEVKLSILFLFLLLSVDLDEVMRGEESLH